MFEVQDKQLYQHFKQKWSIFEINYLCFFDSTAGEKSELGVIMIISKVKVHTSCFQTTIINEIKPTLLFSWPASNVLENFYSYLSPFLTSYVTTPEIYFCKFI